MNEKESERKKQEMIVSGLQAELETLGRRVKAAEEDAESALELAKINIEGREQAEKLLQRTKDEVQILRAQITSHHHDNNQKQFIENSTSPSVVAPSVVTKSINTDLCSALETIVEDDSSASTSVSTRPARSLVAAGRSILHKSTKKEPMVLVTSPGDAVERRRRIKERMESTSGGPLTSHATTKQPQQHLGTMEICRRASKQLKESGKRLRLQGKWWTGNSNGPDELHLDALARHYCIEVENLLDVKNKEILELESLCTLWEAGSGSGL